MFKIQLIGFLTIIQKEVIRVFRIWPQTLMPSVITISLYFLIFGEFIGSRVGLMKGESYLVFIVPGLILMAMITNSFSNVASTFFSAKFQRNIEEMLVSPLDEFVILLGFVTGGVLRGLLVGLLVTGVSSFFWDFKIHNLGLVVMTMFLTTFLFSLGGFLNGLFARKFDDISIIPTFILVPLTYLGGIFYSIELLPPFWQKVSLLNPVLYLINLFRYGFLGISDIPVYSSLIILCLTVSLLLFVGLMLLKQGRGIRE